MPDYRSTQEFVDAAVRRVLGGDRRGADWIFKNVMQPRDRSCVGTADPALADAPPLERFRALVEKALHPAGALMSRLEWEEACGFHCREEYVVAAVEAHLLTPEDRAFLDAHNLSIEKVLTGRFTVAVTLEVDALLDRWNTRLGWHEFGY